MGAKPENIEAWLAQLGNPAADRDYRPGHERMQLLVSRLDCRAPRLRIRIAGTNGKGSTAFMLAAALESAGFKVGLYTSPHICNFNERIRINGVPVAEAQLLQSLERIMPMALDVGASYFETATALALDQFSRAAVEIEILEAGVGARLDATTAVAAEMALITPIALDHQNWLGDSLTEIAAEKAHVMQGCSKAISAPQSEPVAALLRSFRPDLCFSDSKQMQIPLATPGAHQHINASLAWSALQQLVKTLPAIDLQQARAAISDCVVPGRLQQMHIGSAEIWLDAAHNRHAVEALLPWLESRAYRFDAVLLFTREDRSLKDAVPLLAPFTDRLIGNHEQPGLSAEEGFRMALEGCPNGRFLVLGSFLTVAAIQRMLSPRSESDGNALCAEGITERGEATG